LSESNAQKAEANKFFGSSQYSEAIGEYDKALASCPNYLEYEVAVLKSNIAACHLKLEDWKLAVETATAALDALDRLFPRKAEKEDKGEDDGGVVEIEGDDEATEQELARLQNSDQRRDDIQRIRAKALMRRAKARTEEGGWGNLQGAEEGTAIIPHNGDPC
jgi:tetratricopeptide (TPR) repeat protein